MDETEVKLAGVELLLIELMAWLPRGALEDAGRSLQAGLDAGPCDEECRARRHALQLIEDACNRFSRSPRPPPA